MDLEEKIELAAKWIAESKKLVIFTGAGISTDSGLPDYRGPDGVWTRRDKGLPPSKSPPWDQVTPNAGHMAIVDLLKMGKLDCRTCHGDHAKTEKIPPYKVNRITGYSINIWGKNIAGFKFNTWDRMKMDDCAECHTQKGREQNNECFVCHK